MVYLILKFWVEWTTATSVYFSSTQCRQFMAYCASLVELYAHTHAGKVIDLNVFFLRALYVASINLSPYFF